MAGPDYAEGLDELRAIRRRGRSLVWLAGFLSLFVNLLMLTGPLFMLQVYDRVLGSRSEETLVALFGLMAFLFLIMGILDWARGRLFTRFGARFQADLDRRVFGAVLSKSALDPGKADEGENQLKDLEAVQRFYGSPVFMALFDIPWTPVFLLAISIFHPWLGMLALGGGGLLIAVTVINQLTTRAAVLRAAVASYKSERTAEHLKTEAETIRSLGMQDAAFDRWHKARAMSLRENTRAADMGGSFTTGTKTFRLFLQSAMLGVGAYLVLQGDLTPGAMIASSILLGRALMPVDIVVGQWSSAQRARRGWENLSKLLSEIPPEINRLELPKPKAHLRVQQLVVVPPGARQATLKMVSFDVNPGEAIGVIGQSGSGKSTLARALCNVWKPSGGKIRLDGAALDQYDPAKLAQYIGYLPQRVQLFGGTIAENIARLSTQPNDALVVEAAKKAAAHDMILQFPNGYDTMVNVSSTRLSGGQIQRIGLARALYNNPEILVLDEPNSNLDNEGTEALNAAVLEQKTNNRAVIIMAHRPAAIQQCDKLLVLENGAPKVFGPREEVLAAVVTNYRDLKKAEVDNKLTGVA